MEPDPFEPGIDGLGREPAADRLLTHPPPGTVERGRVEEEGQAHNRVHGDQRARHQRDARVAAGRPRRVPCRSPARGSGRQWIGPDQEQDGQRQCKRPRVAIEEDDGEPHDDRPGREDDNEGGHHTRHRAERSRDGPDVDRAQEPTTLRHDGGAEEGKGSERRDQRKIVQQVPGRGHIQQRPVAGEQIHVERAMRREHVPDEQVRCRPRIPADPDGDLVRRRSSSRWPRRSGPRR